MPAYNSFKDKWSGSFDNSVGSTVEVDRTNVDNNRNNGCSHGLHVGSLNYVKDYGDDNNGDQFREGLNNTRENLIVIRINPSLKAAIQPNYNFY